ncbi:TPA: hypothetical protein DEP86_01875 [Candidatus Uhrbacteria bacterium]|nr:hypothetical protein [Candidatus Uhrbacteria bacterium]
MSIFERVRQVLREEDGHKAEAERATRIERRQQEALAAEKWEEHRLRLAQPYLNLVEAASASLDSLLADSDFVVYFRAVLKERGKGSRWLLFFEMSCGTYGIGGFETDIDCDIGWEFWLDAEASGAQRKFVLVRNAMSRSNLYAGDWGLEFQPTKYGLNEAASVGERVKGLLGSMQTPESLLRYLFERFGRSAEYSL